MPIIPGQKGRATDFIFEADIASPRSDDEGRVVKLEDDGRLSNEFVPTLNIAKFTAGEALTKGDSVFLADTKLQRHDLNTNTSDLGEDFTNGTYYRSNTYITPNVTNKIFIKKMKLYWDKGGGSSGGTNLGTYTMYIYAVDGSDVPTGSPLYTSNNTTVNTFFTADGEITMTFPTACELVSNTKYAYVFKFVGTDSNDHSNLLGGGSPAGYVTSHASSNGTSWSPGSGAFYLKMDYYFGDVNKLYKTNAKYYSSLNFLGFVMKDVSASAVATIQLGGRMSVFSGLTANSLYYLSDTSGALSSSAGTISRKVAQAYETTSIIFNIRGQNFNRYSLDADVGFPCEGFVFASASMEIYDESGSSIVNISDRCLYPVKKGWYSNVAVSFIDAIKII